MKKLSKFGTLAPFGLCLLAAVAGSGGCSTGFPVVSSTERVVVKITDASTLGDGLHLKPITVDTPDTYPVSLEVLRADGTRNTDFNGYLRILVKPGSITGLGGPDGSIAGRNVKLKDGFVDGISVSVNGTFGQTRIVAEDSGYDPVDPLRTPPPQCSDGIDNDGDGTIDFPIDPGCEFANDDSEAPGSYAAGASSAIFYNLPRVEDIRNAIGGGASTPYKEQQVAVDTGYRDATGEHLFDFIVTRISTSGFYVMDVETDRTPETRRGYSSLFAFNFSAPAQMRVCDKLRRLAGTAKEFYGSIQLSFPTWEIEAWNPQARPCGVPEPSWLKPSDIYVFPLGKTITKNIPVLLKAMHSLVRVQAGAYDVLTDDGTGNKKPVTHTVSVHISKHFGAKNPLPATPGAFDFVMADDATNCDFNGDGTVDFATDPEKSCSTACDNDADCSEWSNYKSRSQFQLTVVDSWKDLAGAAQVQTAKIQANGGTAQGFSPTDLRGQNISGFTGSMGYFSGGTQFTIEARCIDDIVTDVAAKPKSSNEACIFPRTEHELESL